MKEKDFPTKNCRIKCEENHTTKTSIEKQRANGSATTVLETYIHRTKKYFVKLYKRYYMFNLLLTHFPSLSSSILC